MRSCDRALAAFGRGRIGPVSYPVITVRVAENPPEHCPLPEKLDLRVIAVIGECL